ncbi:MAG: hypothetical protein VX583_14550 [Bdellovibrionota bacterium]
MKLVVRKLWKNEIERRCALLLKKNALVESELPRIFRFLIEKPSDLSIDSLICERGNLYTLFERVLVRRELKLCYELSSGKIGRDLFKKNRILGALLNSDPFLWDKDLQAFDKLWESYSKESLSFYLRRALASLVICKEPELYTLHVDYLSKLLKRLLSMLKNFPDEDFEFLCQHLEWFFTGTFNMGTEVNYLEIQTLKASLMEVIFDRKFNLGQDKCDLTSFSEDRIIVLRDHLEENSELNHIRKSIDFLQAEYDIVYLGFSEIDYVIEISDTFKGKAYLLPRKELKRSLEFVRTLGAKVCLYSSPNSGRLFNQSAYLVSKRVASFQVHFLADIVSSGIKEMDFFALGNAYSEDNLRHEFGENFWKLPGIACNIPSTVFSGVSSKANDKIMLSSGNLFKLNTEVLKAWMQILKNVDNSSLVLMPFSSTQTRAYELAFRKLLSSVMNEFGVSRDRVLIQDLQGQEAVMKAIKQARVYLDTYPYSGSTSIFEPLSLGVPIVSKKGINFRASMGESLLSFLGLGHCVANDEEEYIRKVSDLLDNDINWLEYKRMQIESLKSFQGSLRNSLHSESLDAFKVLFSKNNLNNSDKLDL